VKVIDNMNYEHNIENKENHIEACMEEKKKIGRGRKRMTSGMAVL
jgi:hypothetical protein